jgi:DNA-binding NtrC family response regulator
VPLVVLRRQSRTGLRPSSIEPSDAIATGTQAGYVGATIPILSIGAPAVRLEHFPMATILCVDDEPAIQLMVTDTLRQAGHEPITAGNVPEALRVLERERVDLILSDYRMPGLTGLEFLALLEREGYAIPLIMLTGYASIEHAVTAIRAGAVDYIAKPIRPEQLKLSVEQALELVRLRRENELLRREVTEIRAQRQIIGDSTAIRRVLQTVAAAAPTRAPVLLLGESGTGKELFARALHEQSDRRRGPFIQLNCAALPDGLVESALFGHEKGAFTGAIKRVEGAFERAHGGTLLLDEITEMKRELQAKLLRVLQEQEFERVGGTEKLRVDVRIVATSNRDVQSEIEAGNFRQDLFYRIATFPLQIPSLRERREDIPQIAFHFARRAATRLGKQIDGISPEALQLLQSYDWPGNVRELEHAVERASIMSTTPLLQPDSFELRRYGMTPDAWADSTGTTPAAAAGPADADGAGVVVLRSLNVAEAEELLIQRALQVTANNRTKAAELLGMSVRTLRSKINRPDTED